MGKQVYVNCKHPNCLQFMWENRKHGIFPPKWLLVKTFVHIIDLYTQNKTFSKGK